MSKGKAKKGKLSSKDKKTYSSGRVKRGKAPERVLTTSQYRKALPELRRDFHDRCAYCMRHIGTETEMQVDHFDPRMKQDKIQVYSNLFLADAHCNGAKSDEWPTDEERAAGCRFLNCCEEEDYDKVIFEDFDTHELIGTTTAAKYHIEVIDLNDPGLILERKHRFDMLAKLNALLDKTSSDPVEQKLVSDIADLVKDLIPPIKGPPGTWTELPIVTGIKVKTK